MLCSSFLNSGTLVHHLVIGLLVVLRVFEIIISTTAHSAMHVLRGVLGLIIDGGTTYNTNVLRDIIITSKLSNIVFVTNRVFIILLLLLLLDLSKLTLSQSLDFPEHLDEGFAISLKYMTLQLFFHLLSYTLCPTSDLVSDQTHVLFTSLQAFKLCSELNLFFL